jgi:hypothetical protein
MNRRQKPPRRFVHNPAYRQAFQRLDESLEQNPDFSNDEKKSNCLAGTCSKTCGTNRNKPTPSFCRKDLMTRNGKIARLTRAIRDELNRRLQDGEPGVRLVAWLNGLPETQKILQVDFGGRPINEQNLSE